MHPTNIFPLLQAIDFEDIATVETFLSHLDEVDLWTFHIITQEIFPEWPERIELVEFAAMQNSLIMVRYFLEESQPVYPLAISNNALGAFKIALIKKYFTITQYLVKEAPPQFSHTILRELPFIKDELLSIQQDFQHQQLSETALQDLQEILTHLNTLMLSTKR